MKSFCNQDKRILIVVSTPMVIEFFLEDILRAVNKKFKVTIVCNKNDYPAYFNRISSTFHVVHIPIKRNINLFFDLYAFTLLFFYLLFNRFAIIHSVTPKAGLLTMIASWVTFNKIRVHTFQGQIWPIKSGLMRFILKSTDLITSKLSSFLLFVSKSEINFLLKNNILNKAQKYSLINNGSISGINLKKFNTKRLSSKKKFTFIFLGRVHKDKGIDILLEAFCKFNKKNESQLFIVGPLETYKQEYFSKFDNVRYFKKTKNQEKFLALSDCLILPSFREAFGMVVLEANAMGIPVIGTNIYGLNESIKNGFNGLLCKVGSSASLLSKMNRIYYDKNLYSDISLNAKANVEIKFDRKDYIEFYINFYTSLINS